MFQYPDRPRGPERVIAERHIGSGALHEWSGKKTRGGEREVHAHVIGSGVLQQSAAAADLQGTRRVQMVGPDEVSHELRNSSTTRVFAGRMAIFVVIGSGRGCRGRARVCLLVKSTRTSSGPG